LYGTINYAVTRRRAELSMRLALGASPGGVLRMILREIGTLIMAGVALGVLVALASVRLLSAFLYGLTPSDPLTWTASTALLVVVALAAGALPAWKAARQDPMLVLRQD
jgi:ABC-type antimicrobial peptide transport system permease subunit